MLTIALVREILRYLAATAWRLSRRRRLWSKETSALRDRLSMLKFLPVLLLLLPVVAVAQEVPLEAERDLWCGTALKLMTRDVPADITPEKQAAASVYAEGGQRLIDRAIPIYLESGYAPEVLDSFRARLETQVGRVVNGSDGGSDDAPYTFQDCAALIGQ
jgi:hypothetical protein